MLLIDFMFHQQPADFNEDFYTFHEAISHLQELEDEVFDRHKAFVDSHQKWLNTHNNLLQMSSQVDYDQEGYAVRLEELIADQEESLKDLKAKVSAFRSQLNEEEMMSKKIVKKKK